MKTKHINKPKRVLCAECKKPIRIDDFGGITKDGLLHTLCLAMRRLKK